jgi:hypothetical protein
LSPSVSSIGSQAYVSGLFGQGIFFNQTGGTTPTQFLSYNLPTGITANNCTISMWVKPSFTIIPSTFGNQISVCLGDSQSTTNYQFGMNNNPQPFIYFNSPPTTSVSSGVSASTGVWYHMVGVFSNVGQTGQNTLLTYYHNGISQGSASLTRSATSFINLLKIGGRDSGTGSAFVSVQDLRIYNTALSAPQILGIYQSQGIPPRLTATSNVVQPSLLFSFNGSNVDSVTNLSPSSTLGTPSYTTGKYGQGIFFPFYNTGSTPSITYTIPSISCNGITICMWAYFNDLSMFRLDSVTQNIFTATVPYTGFPNQQLVINSRTAGGTQNMLFQGANGASGFFSYTATVAKQWYHLTLVSSGSGSPSSYVNGVSYATTGSTLTPFSLNSLTLTGNNCVYNDFRIYNTALSAQQIQGIYLSGGVPPNMALTQTSRSGTSTTMNSG